MAKKQREEFEKANRTLMSKVKKGAELEVADMGVTYDDNGKVLKIRNADPSLLPKTSGIQNVVQSGLRNDLTEVVQSEVMTALMKL